MTIREQVSTRLGVRIPDNGWKETFDLVSVTGKLDHKTVVDLLLILCQKIEELEQENGPRIEKITIQPVKNELPSGDVKPAK